MVKKKTLRLAADHTWKAPVGFKTMVIDRGAVSFNFPEKWIVVKWEPNLELNDRKPPHDKARFSISYWRLLSGVDWQGLPLTEMLKHAADNSEYETLSRGEMVQQAREDLEVAWMEQSFLDPNEKREARTRIALARGNGVQVLITFDFWPEDGKRLQPAWEEALRSLQLGRRIADPTKGMTLH